MPAMASCQPSSSSDVRLALALALVKARSSQSASLQHWKKKAKIRKKELVSLRKELQQVQCDCVVSEILPPAASCKCSFFMSSEGNSGTTFTDVHENDISQLIFRRFLRNVNTWEHPKDHRKKDWAVGLGSDREEQLSVTVKFLIELVGKVKPGTDAIYFATYVHQAIDFIKDTLGQLLQDKKQDKVIAERIIAKLVSQLLGKILGFSCGSNLEEVTAEIRSWILQILMRLGVIPFVGQRMLLIASQQIVLVTEGLIFMDPFDNSAPQVHDNMYSVLQLIEKLISYQSSSWKNDSSFDERLLEEWVDRYFQMKKASELLGHWNSLFCVYIERITGEVVKQLHRLSDIEKVQRHCHKAFIKFVNPDTNQVL